jgi:hypothetical protein
MIRNLIRLSKANDLPFARSTLYKWHHMKKFQNIFVKISGALFVDLNELNRIIEQGKGK